MLKSYLDLHLRVPMPALLALLFQECDCVSLDIDPVDFRLTRSNSTSLGTLKALYPL